MTALTFISVIVPLRLAWEPCYHTSDQSISVGDRVRVSFSGREYVGVVSGVGVTPDTPVSRIKGILGKAEDLDPVVPVEIGFWRSIASYYLCTVGEVYKAAYPSAMVSREELESRKESRLEERIRKREDALKRARKDSVKERLTAEIRDLKAIRTGPGLHSGIPRLDISKPLQRAYVQVQSAFSEGRTALLLGPDRLMIYLKAASDVLSSGRSVLMLIPEINLGRQWENRIREFFPELLIYHSGESPVSRGEVAARVRSGAPVLVMGTRSSIFLPFRNLGLVVVEQEQDPSFKQDNPSPRYNSRDASMLLAKTHGAKVILGSASPSLESVYNSISGKYREIRTTWENHPELPVTVVDITSERRKRGMVGALSVKLMESMAGVLEAGRQVLLLCPRRTILQDAIGEQVRNLFPGRSVVILEGGVTQARQKRIISEFTAGETDILIGTHMMAKGLDSRNLGLIALLGADSLSAQEDFRADERAFQTIGQLREREWAQGCSLIVQTAREGHPVFSMDGDIVQRLLQERKAASLPPYTRQVDIIMKDTFPERLARLSRELRSSLPVLPGAVVTGPYRPSAANAASDMMVIGVFLPKDRNLASSKKALMKAADTFGIARKWSSHLSLDVDP